MDSWIRDQIGLEFSNINVQGSIESQRGSQRGNDLGYQSVQVGIGWSFNIQLSSADIIDSFIVQHNINISVFQQRVGRQDTVVWFNDGS